VKWRMQLGVSCEGRERYDVDFADFDFDKSYSSMPVVTRTLSIRMLGKNDSWRRALMVGKAPTVVETRRGRNYLVVLITCIFSLREPFGR
jgi:hypothetical protein